MAHRLLHARAFVGRFVPLSVFVFAGMRALSACGSSSTSAAPDATTQDASALLEASVNDAAVPTDATSAFDASDSGVTALAADVLVFDSNRGGNFEIYRMNSDATGATALTNNTSFDSWWGRPSPDRTQILFYRRAANTMEEYSKAALWMMNADGSNAHELRPAGTDGWGIQGHGEWSPDGTHLAMCGTAGTGASEITAVYVTDAQGANPRAVASSGGWNCDPSWSPDGNTLIFNHCDTPSCTSYQIYTVPQAGGTPVALSNNAFVNYDPYFSHDGTRVAWLVETSRTANVVGSGDAGVALGSWGVFSMSPDGGSPATIINDGQVNSKPAWSRSDGTIYFHRMVPATSLTFGVYSILPDGGGMTTLTAETTESSEYPTN